MACVKTRLFLLSCCSNTRALTRRFLNSSRIPSLLLHSFDGSTLKNCLLIYGYRAKPFPINLIFTCMCNDLFTMYYVTSRSHTVRPLMLTPRNLNWPQHSHSCADRHPVLDTYDSFASALTKCGNTCPAIYACLQQPARHQKFAQNSTAGLFSLRIWQIRVQACQVFIKFRLQVQRMGLGLECMVCLLEESRR